MIDTLLECYRLKHLDRAGWVREGVTAVESVASHSWGISLLALALAPEELDRARLLTFAALHDLPEAHVGDITPHDGVSRADKRRLEHNAMDQLSAGLSKAGGALRASWLDYEDQACAESQFIRQLDRLDMAVQALCYQQQHPELDLRPFVASARKAVKHPTLVALLDTIEARLSSARES